VEQAMKIKRAGVNDTDLFTDEQLKFGACCFYSEDRALKYVFEINGQEARLLTSTDQYVNLVIDEFLFYSGFVTTIKNKDGYVIAEKAQVRPYMYEISKIQPSQFYISKTKLENCKKWIKSPEDIFIPIIVEDGVHISLDGHTRMKAALDFGYPYVLVYPDKYDKSIFYFVDEAIKRNVTSIFDIDVVSDMEYALKWDKFCDDLFERITETSDRCCKGRNGNTQ
jgi:hypothetical protein